MKSKFYFRDIEKGTFHFRAYFDEGFYVRALISVDRKGTYQGYLTSPIDDITSLRDSYLVLSLSPKCYKGFKGFVSYFRNQIEELGNFDFVEEGDSFCFTRIGYVDVTQDLLLSLEDIRQALEESQSC